MHPLAENARQVLQSLRNGRGNARMSFEGEQIKQLRESFNMTQNQFACNFGFSLSSLRNWENNHRIPEISSQLILGMISEYPDDFSRLVNSMISDSRKEHDYGTKSSEATTNMEFTP